MIVVSDLHLGGIDSQVAKDNCIFRDEFVKFVECLPTAHDGVVELYINGDFIDFPRICPEIYSATFADHWCTSGESLEKLSCAIEEHKDVFNVLKKFQARGNIITIAAGNHDVDFFWESVQSKLVRILGPTTKFDTGADLYERYNGRLVIAHGHMFDPANRFKNWRYPVSKAPDGEPRLEMCPGTLFLVKFVNWLEQDYPFAEGLNSIFSLAVILLKEDRPGFRAAARMLLNFAGLSIRADLGSANVPLSTMPLINEIRSRLKYDEVFRSRFISLFRETRKFQIEPQVAIDYDTEDGVGTLLKEIVVSIYPEEWLSFMDLLDVPYLGGSNDGTLSLAHHQVTGIADVLRAKAKQILYERQREVVIFGHSHQPDEWRGMKNDLLGGYFNPGSWTTIIDPARIHELSLEDLRNGKYLRHQLNYIGIEEGSSGHLIAEKICFNE